jgi:hypothetical protein
MPEPPSQAKADGTERERHNSEPSIKRFNFIDFTSWNQESKYNHAKHTKLRVGRLYHFRLISQELLWQQKCHSRDF